MTSLFPIMASSEEPTLVRAIVRELIHDPSSAPIEWRNLPGKQPPVWTARLEIEEVLRGDRKLKGEAMITATADSEPDGNWRVVTPLLNVEDEGIWAIKRLADPDESWAEVYSPYEIAKGVSLPLIKGRDDAYSKVLQQLSGGAVAPEPSNGVKEPQEKPVKTMPTTPPLAVQPPAPKTAPEAKSGAPALSMEPVSSTPWSIVVVLIVAAIGLLWLLLKGRK